MDQTNRFIRTSKTLIHKGGGVLIHKGGGVLFYFLGIRHLVKVVE